MSVDIKSVLYIHRGLTKGYSSTRNYLRSIQNLEANANNTIRYLLWQLSAHGRASSFFNVTAYLDNVQMYDAFMKFLDGKDL